MIFLQSLLIIDFQHMHRQGTGVISVFVVRIRVQLYLFKSSFLTKLIDRCAAYVASSGKKAPPSQRYRLPPDFCRGAITAKEKGSRVWPRGAS